MCRAPARLNAAGASQERGNGEFETLLPEQRAMPVEVFSGLYKIECPGTIVDLPFKWRREDYGRYNDVRALEI